MYIFRNKEINKSVPEIIDYLEKNTYRQNKSDEIVEYRSNMLQGIRENDYFLLRRIIRNEKITQEGISEQQKSKSFLSVLEPR
mgnify:CR=1 FL=1